MAAISPEEIMIIVLFHPTSKSSYRRKRRKTKKHRKRRKSKKGRKSRTSRKCRKSAKNSKSRKSMKSRKIGSCVYSAKLPLVNANWPWIGGNWWGPRILPATGPEQIILSAHRQRLTGLYSPGISYEIRSIDLSSFV